MLRETSTVQSTVHLCIASSLFQTECTKTIKLSTDNNEETELKRKTEDNATELQDYVSHEMEIHTRNTKHKTIILYKEKAGQLKD